MSSKIFSILYVVICFIVAFIACETPLEAGVDYIDEDADIVKRTDAFEFERLISEHPQYEEDADQLSVSTEATLRKEVSKNHRSQSPVTRHPRRSSIKYEMPASSSQRPEAQRLQSEDVASRYLQPPPTTESLVDAQFQNWIPVPWIRLLSEASFRRSNPPPIEYEMMRQPPPVIQNRIESDAEEENSYGARPNSITNRSGVSNGGASYGDANIATGPIQTPNEGCTCSPVQRYGQNGNAGARRSDANFERPIIDLNYKTLDDVLAEVIDESGYDGVGGDAGGNQNFATSPTPLYQKRRSQQTLPTPNRRDGNVHERQKYKQMFPDAMKYGGMLIEDEETLARVCRQFSKSRNSQNKYTVPPPPAPPKTFLSPAPYLMPDAGRQENGVVQSAGYLAENGRQEGKRRSGSVGKKSSQHPMYGQVTPASPNLSAPKITTNYVVSVTHPPTPNIKWSVTPSVGNNPYISNQWKNMTLRNSVKGYQTQKIKTPTKNYSVSTPASVSKNSFSESYAHNDASLAFGKLAPRNFASPKYSPASVKQKQLDSDAINEQLTNPEQLASPKTGNNYTANLAPKNTVSRRTPTMYQLQQQKYWNQRARRPNYNLTPTPIVTPPTNQTPPTNSYQVSESYESSHPVFVTTPRMLYASPFINYSSTTPPTKIVGGVKGGGGVKKSSSTFYQRSNTKV